MLTSTSRGRKRAVLGDLVGRSYRDPSVGRSRLLLGGGDRWVGRSRLLLGGGDRYKAMATFRGMTEAVKQAKPRY